MNWYLTMSETTPEITVPAGLDVVLTCHGCRHLLQELCDKPNGDEHVTGLSGVTITKDHDANDYITEVVTCTEAMRRRFGACVGLAEIEWVQDEDEMDEDSEYPEDHEYFCPVEQIVSGWSPATYRIDGNELVMESNAS